MEEQKNISNNALNEAIKYLDYVLQFDERWSCKENKNECMQLKKWLDELKVYKALEEQGKLLKLPCANWMEIVFGAQEVFWGIDMDYIENPIREISVDNSERMTWYDGWKTVVLKGADENGLDWEFSPEEIGKTVFLTKEEAKAALKELKKIK